jgi:hypothetical protein
MNLPLANGRYIHQWETPINECLVLAYGRDQIQWAFPDFECGKFIPLRRFAGSSLFEVNEPDETLIMEIIVLVGWRIIGCRHSH